MNQRDNGVSMFKVCLQTLKVFPTGFTIQSCVCVQLSVSPVIVHERQQGGSWVPPFSAPR